MFRQAQHDIRTDLHLPVPFYLGGFSEGDAIHRETVSLSWSKACKRCFDKLNMTSSPTFICSCALYDAFDFSEGNVIHRDTVSLSWSKACKRCFDKLNMTSGATFICPCAVSTA